MSLENAVRDFDVWDYPGVPDEIRIFREPFTHGDVEVEFLKEGERQGRIFDVDYSSVLDWLRLRGITITETLVRAYDAAWNFGHVLYFVQYDHFRILPGN